jgi:hypothetical protein
MEITRLGHWLLIGANLGILCGLIFVAVQLYQDRQLKAIELSMAQLDNSLQVRLALMGEQPHLALIKSVTEPDAVSPEEALVLSQIYAADLILYEQTLYMQRSGLWPDYDVAIPLTMRTAPGYRYVDASLAILPLSESTRTLWRNLLDSGEADDILAGVIEGIRDEDAAQLLKERYRLALEMANEIANEVANERIRATE